MLKGDKVAFLIPITIRKHIAYMEIKSACYRGREQCGSETGSLVYTDEGFILVHYMPESQL